jgi:hypothetical protein
LFLGHLESHPGELPKANSDVFADRFVAALAVSDQWPAPSLKMRAVAPAIAVVLEQIHEVLRTIVDVRAHVVPAQLAGNLLALTRKIPP